ncbi:MAG: secondary thiamine-phosphate synthase [Gammaproteobacteria bacterium RIFCSPHIGHO2_12_FULL_42_13]|nr:MAG: secondary thiamine-phosphate synthase [Gammaproteobacteria bacterium RIFCSPHIGHO2_12_FULL_42_13]
MLTQHTLTISTPGRGMVDVTDRITEIVQQTQVSIGLCNIFLHHTSASLLICENADMDVQKDLEAFMCRLTPDGDKLFVHVAEGPDDMPSHIRTVLTQSSLTIPITANQLALGQWQSIYLWEHRLRPYQRKLTITIHGKS